MILLCIVFLQSPRVGAFSGEGVGDNQGSEYIITTCEQLQEIADDLNAWYKLGNNIDCSGSATWNSNAGFMPIGSPDTSFHGILEGAGFTISGLTINRPNTDYVGLFGYIGGAGSAERFRFKDISITGRNYVGGVAGQTLNGDVYNIGITGLVTGVDVVGGAVGDNGGGVMNMYSRATINGVPASGVGGGLVGENHGFIIRSYSTGTVPSGTGKGGLVGHDAGSGGVFGSFWDTQTSGTNTSGEGTGKTSIEMKNVATFTDSTVYGVGTLWDFVGNPNDDINNDETWDINSRINQGYPYLTAQTPGEPDTFILDQPGTYTNDSTPAFQFESNVTNATFLCSIDSGSYSSCSNSYEAPSVLVDGEHSLSVKAVNADSVEDLSPAAAVFTVDTIVPDTALTRLGEHPNANASSSFSLTSTESPVTFRCELDNTGFKLCHNPFNTPNLNPGEHTLVVKAVDAAGNVDPSPETFSWTVDPSLFDGDNDGHLDTEENNGPNNGDGTADAEQSNVVSYLNTVSGNYAVFETNCESVTGLEVTAESTEHPDSDYNYPFGLAGFQINCGTNGDTARIRQYYYGVTGSNLYKVRKWKNNSFYEGIPEAQNMGTPINGEIVFLVEYNITDGGRFDDDGQENGVIVDPSGAALQSDQNTSSAPISAPLASTGEDLTSFAIIAILLLSGAVAISTVIKKNRKTS